MFVLVVRVPGEPLRRMPLGRAPVTLGRASSNDIPLADRTLSRQHARITPVDGGAVLEDMGSRNGTFLNGAAVSGRLPLAAGDRIRLGETSIDVAEDVGSKVVFDEHSSVSVESTVMRTSFAQLRAPEGADDPRSAPQALARANAALRLLNEISIELLHDLDRERLVTLVMDKIFATLGPDRALLMLADEAGNLREETTRFGPGVPSSDFRLSSTLVSTVMEKKSGVLMIDALSREPLSIADSIKIQGVTSCLAAPLLVEDQKVLGLLYLDVRLGRKSFTPDDLRLASLIANTAAIKLENLRLQEGAAARAQMEREMSLAFEVQRRLLPERAPTLVNTSLRGHNVPSRRVSGDYYDFFSRRDGTWDAVVADVCGKGMAASILAASVQAAYHAWADENLPPDRLCERLNDFVYKRTSPEKFVTFIVAHYDPESGSLLYTNAGHNPGVLLRADGTHEELGAHGTPLGLLPNRTYGSGVYTMRPGDLLVLYTDGVTEACDPDDAEFGLERLVSTVSAVRTRPLEEIEKVLGDTLVDFARGTPFADDRTVVLLRREAETVAVAAAVAAATLTVTVLT